MDARIRELTPRSWGQSLTVCMGQVSAYVQGWMAHFRTCTEEGAAIFRRFDAHIRRRLRAIIIHQKGRRPRYLYRHLRACEVPEGAAARTAYSRRGLWCRSNLPGITRAYKNAWFSGRLTSLWNEWFRLNPPTPVSNEQLLLFDGRAIDLRSRM